MAFPRRALLMGLIIFLPVALAGCNFSLWQKQQGEVKVYVVPQGPAKTALNNFQKLKIAVLGVSLKQAGSLQTMEFSYGSDPLVVDMVDKGTHGTKVQVAQNVTGLHAFESITIRIEVTEAVDSTGRSLPNCHPNEPVTSHPCVSTPSNGAYRIDGKNFSPTRGGTVAANFPLAVLFDQPTNEYYIQADPALFSTPEE